MTENNDQVHARVTLGHSDISMRPIGLGCMTMSQSYGDADRDDSVAVLREAIDLGVGMFDTADVYGAADAAFGAPTKGFGHNEELIGEALAGRRDEVVIATKFAVRMGDQGEIGLVGDPAYVAQACEASLRRLRTDHIDLYYCHRQDPSVPIEETVGAMGELVTQGKVRAIGHCELPVDQLRRAHATFPLSALQSEYSLWERSVEDDGVVAACRELGITLVPYSPLGRAMLTGRINRDQVFAATDFRSLLPRFRGENLDHNIGLVDALEKFSAAKGATPGQVALAWLLAQPLDVIPIPGTKRVRYLRENTAATDVALSADEVARLGALFHPAHVRGGRHPAPEDGR
ncbi:aldo/keto reductase [Herbidospora mongoliensis]|uniref:aldo/keto reductase n=1 Tax=Herbidospora mongoliensis TaxID=688067 RepID=UPI00082F628C|nr:aldo/keto reductase [Herbidospora mongoliensis]